MTSRTKLIQRTAIIPAIVLAVVALVALPNQAANAESPKEIETVLAGNNPDIEPAPMHEGQPEALAEGLGVSVEEVKTRFAGQTEFQQAISDAKNRWPERYADSAWEVADNSSGWVSFTGAVDKEIVEAFAQVPVGVELRFNARVSENTAENIKQTVMEDLAATGSFAEMSGRINPTSGEVAISYNLKPGAKFSAQAEREVTSQVKKHVGVTVSVDQATEDISSEPEALRGGTAVSDCTTGFTIRILPSSPVKKGILSAAHCGNSPGKPTGSAYSLTFVNQHVGNYGEVQALRSNDPTVHNHIRVNKAGSETWIMTQTAWPTTGASVCNYGKTRTSYSCTTVRATGLSFWADTDTGGTAYVGRMAQSNGKFTNPGDSGGPWFENSTAIGIHYGKYGGYSSFSTVPDAQSILGVNVLIN